MNIFKNFMIVGCVIFVGMELSGIVFAKPVNVQPNQEDTFNVWIVNETGSSFEIKKYGLDINSSIAKVPPQPCSSGESNVSTVLGSSRLTSINGMLFNAPAPISSVEPTTTVNLVFEKVEIPFNGIPGGISLEDAEEMAELFGAGVTVSEDPNNDNRIILTLPALTVEESHDVLCEVFDVFSPPRLLIRETILETLVAVDIELVRFSNTPFLLTHTLPGSSDGQDSVKGLALNKMEDEAVNQIPTDLIVSKAGELTLLTRKIVDAEVMVKDQFEAPMSGVEVAATVVSNSKIKDAEIISPSSIRTDINGKAVFFFRFPLLGGSITFTAGGLSKIFTVGL